MARLVQSADANKAKIVRLADRWAVWVVIGALASAVGVYAATGEILRAVTVLVVFCPCSLVLATPTVIMAAIGNATKQGFLVKEGDALERLAAVKKVVFDKTGTLTKGEPHVTAFALEEQCPVDIEDAKRLVASAEKRSEHPLARAIVDDALRSGIATDDVEQFEMIPGRGVRATVDGFEVAVGNEALLADLGVGMRTKDLLPIDELRSKGCTLTYFSIDGTFSGIAALSDTVREESAAMVRSVRDQGVVPVLLTGDHRAAASVIASSMGIREFVSDCKPEDKMDYIERAERSGEFAAMIGDGVNDAPALKRSYVGIAMGGIGSDIAIDAADIVIVNDNVGGLPHLLSLSRHMMRVIKANLTFSMTLNFVAIVLAFLAISDPVRRACSQLRQRVRYRELVISADVANEEVKRANAALVLDFDVLCDCPAWCILHSVWVMAVSLKTIATCVCSGARRWFLQSIVVD